MLRSYGIACALPGAIGGDMLGNYANQSLTLIHYASINQYNEGTSPTTTTIKGRKETGNNLVRNKEGQEVVSTACVFTDSVITEGDLIDNDLVTAVNPAIDLSGQIRFYKAWLI